MTTEDEQEHTTGNEELDDLLAAQAAAQEEMDEDDVELDLSEAGSYAPFEGKHPAVITKIEFTRAKSGSKAPMLKTEVTVTDGEHKGRKSWPNLMLTGRGTWKTKQVIEALGLEIDLDAHPVQLGKVARLKGIPFLGEFEISKQTGYKDKTELVGAEAITSEDLSELT